jgi:glutathionylspermidine synthase
MIREPSAPRPDWRAKCEAAGLTFHTEGGVPYWDESARYRFTLAQIENDLEGPTGELLAMCYAAIDALIADGRALERLGIPPAFRPAIAESWRLRDRDLYGRFDLAYNGNGPANRSARIRRRPVAVAGGSEGRPRPAGDRRPVQLDP